MELVSITRSASDAKDMSDYDMLKSELRRIKGCIRIVSLLVAFLFLLTLGLLGLIIFELVNANRPPNKFGQIEIKNNTVTDDQELTDELVTEEIKYIKENVSLTLDYLNGVQEATLSLRSRVASLETKFDITDHNLALVRSTLESHLSDSDVQVASLVSLKKLLKCLESRLNSTEDEITIDLMALRGSLTNMETHLNMTTAMVSSLHNNLTSQPSKHIIDLPILSINNNIRLTIPYCMRISWPV